MPKLYRPREILKVLEKVGFEIVSQKGSHLKLEKVTVKGTRTAIVPNHKEVAYGTFTSILKQAGITKLEFEEKLK